MQLPHHQMRGKSNVPVYWFFYGLRLALVLCFVVCVLTVIIWAVAHSMERHAALPRLAIREMPFKQTTIRVSDVVIDGRTYLVFLDASSNVQAACLKP